MARVLAIVLAALGLAYACLWWSFQQFYEQFGISPQDVGLTPSGSASDIASAALQLGIWLLIVVALLTLLPVAAVTAIAVAWGRPVREVKLTIASVCVLLGLTAYLYWQLVDNAVGLILLAIAATAFLLLRSLIPLLERVYIPSSAKPAGAEARAVAAGITWTTTRLALIVALATAIVGMTFIDLPTDAAQAGKCARRYRDPHNNQVISWKQAESVPALNLPIPGLHLPILGVHAQPANLTWLSGSTPPKLADRHVIYLGEAGGSVVVYNRQTHRTRRLPAGSVVVSVYVGAPKCGGVH